MHLYQSLILEQGDFNTLGSRVYDQFFIQSVKTLGPSIIPLSEQRQASMIMGIKAVSGIGCFSGRRGTLDYLFLFL
jgi:hypothetical protein